MLKTKVSRDEYIQSLDVVERYHRQIKKRMLVNEWLCKNTVSRRLHNVLMRLPHLYIDDVTPDDIIKSKGGGIKSFNEFKSIYANGVR